MTRGDGAIRDALALRDAALALLAEQPLSAAQGEALVEAGVGAWQLFLRAECCAGVLAGALRRSRWMGRLVPEVRDAVRDAEGRELQRVLSARAQLRQVDDAAAACGASVVVLKGGALVAEGACLDLGDLDVAAEAACCGPLVEALQRAGYGSAPVRAVPRGKDAEAAGLPWAHVFGVQATLLGVRGALPLELHVVEPTDAATPTTLRPVAGYRSLVRRRGGDALYDLLRHAVVQHPHRRGHLRDLVVLADAVRLCEQGELDAVRERCRGQAHSVELLAMLDQSSALAARSPVADPDATRRIVAQKYLLSSGREAWIARVVPRWHGRLAYVPLERRALRRSELGALARDTMRAHPAYDLPMLAARAPRTARLAAAMVAAGYRLMLATLVLGYGPAVRARVERLLRGGVASRRTPPVHAPPAGELERAAR